MDPSFSRITIERGVQLSPDGPVLDGLTVWTEDEKYGRAGMAVPGSLADPVLSLGSGSWVELQRIVRQASTDYRDYTDKVGPYADK